MNPKSRKFIIFYIESESNLVKRTLFYRWKFGFPKIGNFKFYLGSLSVNFAATKPPLVLRLDGEKALICCVMLPGASGFIFFARAISTIKQQTHLLRVCAAEADLLWRQR